jgi:hypothetical protein
MNDDLVTQYKNKIQPILPLAKKAYGSRTQKSVEHDASREYTRLLTEFYSKGGSLPALAKALNVAYAGVRRRVVMRDVSVASVRPKARILDEEEVLKASIRVKEAKISGIDTYHDQLAKEYKNGIPMSGLARGLGLSSAAPLYYGVQRSLQRNNK